MKKIRAITGASKITMSGLTVNQALPHDGSEMHDPFLLIHHGLNKLPGGNSQKEVGIGPHPHRGFAPVTFVLKGSIHHRDSRGHSEVVKEGGMQWMSAGMGIIHSERPSDEMAEKGGLLEIVQIWINTPEKQKMNTPYYQPVHSPDVPKIKGNQNSVLSLFAGKLGDQQGPVKSDLPVTLAKIDLKTGGTFELDLPAEENSMLYITQGNVQVNGQEAGAKELVTFDNQGFRIEIEGRTESQLLLFSGRPLNEPVSRYGPYVMNTQTELLQAMRDYQMGKMGILIEEFQES